MLLDYELYVSVEKINKIFRLGVNVMNNIKIEIFKALWGESFLITCYGEKDTHIMIDMGFSDTYNNYLKKRLVEISKKNILDTLIFTHIDSDHISGGLSFLKENGYAENPKIIYVGDIWYNAYRHLQFSKREKLQLDKESEEKLKQYNAAGMNVNQFEPKSKISGRQGSILGALILQGKYNWNTKFNNNAVTKSENLCKIPVDDVEITILSPTIDDLKKIDNSWKKELKRLKISTITEDKIFDDAFEVILSKKYDNFLIPQQQHISGSTKDLMNYKNNTVTDTSVTNGSSISFILEFKGRRILFLGDAHHERIVNSLRDISKKLNQSKLWFDAIKISHHGSCANISTDLMELIDSDKFIISTNGDIFNHPDKETIASIVCRESEIVRNLYFNYDNICSRYANKEWMNKYKYNVIGKGMEVIEINL